MKLTQQFKRELLQLAFLIMTDAIDGHIDFPERLASTLEGLARQIRARSLACVETPGLAVSPPSGVDQ